ncbi:Membrane protein involved in the export of O-antigen and teichoic acid [Colwellia chukchiensis]|uniref:Membrane protein involved in the export of O-antigen and teichoic acid n=1 Tax=Colwellia chukchiensis TaxID=641665 RepID=A0A1H7PU88_9GAMM|nr:oligosaccharide flippase family protein [Colwellia chukchiensis]SEL39169.1 Membrane protein involved in the export of O-antigen and teichoic acid [Colwellia chukchiensis]
MTNVSRERRAGVALSYCAIVIRNIAALLLIPFIINHLGVSHYGIYSLVSALAGYLIVLEFGLANTTIRFLAIYKAEQDKAKEAAFISSIMLIYTVLAILVFFIGMALWWQLPAIFSGSLSANENQLLQSAFLILLVNVVITLMSNALTGIISSNQRFRFQKSTEIIVFIVRCLSIVVGLEMGFGVLAIVIIDTTTNFLHSLIRFIYIRRNIDIRFKATLLDWLTLKEVFVYTSFIALNVLVNQINWRVDNLIIGTLTNSTMLGIFNIGNQLVFSFIAFASVIVNIFTTKIMQMVQQGASNKVLMAQLCTIARYQMIVLGYILLIFAFFGELFIYLFVGPAFLAAYWVALIAMVPFILVLAQSSINAVLQALNLHKVRSLLLLATAIVNVILSVYLVQKFGMLGAVWATALALLVGELLLVNIYLYRVVKLNILHLYYAILRYSVPVLLLVALFALTISPYISTTWDGLVVACLLTAMLYLPLSYFIILTANERQQLKSLIRRRGA